MNANILLMAATGPEADPIAARMSGVRRETHVGKALLEGLLGGQLCRLVVSGIGPVNAAQALTRELEAQRPALVLQFGIAGAYVPAGIGVGAVVCATEEIYGDLGVLTPDGWRSVEETGFPTVPGDPPLYNRFALDPGLVARTAEAAAAATGPFLTGSQSTGVQAVGDALHARTGAVCENMEGAAAAHVCALYDVPFLEVRAISNLVEDRDRSRWKMAAALDALHVAVCSIVGTIVDILAED